MAVDFDSLVRTYCTSAAANDGYAFKAIKKIQACSNIILREVVSANRSYFEGGAVLPKELGVKPQSNPFDFVLLSGDFPWLSLAQPLPGSVSLLSSSGAGVSKPPSTSPRMSPLRRHPVQSPLLHETVASAGMQSSSASRKHRHSSSPRHHSILDRTKEKEMQKDQAEKSEKDKGQEKEIDKEPETTQETPSINVVRDAVVSVESNASPVPSRIPSTAVSDRALTTQDLYTPVSSKRVASTSFAPMTPQTTNLTYSASASASNNNNNSSMASAARCDLALSRVIGYNGGPAVLLYNGALLLTAVGSTIVIVDLTGGEESTRPSSGLWRAFPQRDELAKYEQGFLKGHRNKIGLVEVSGSETYMITAETDVKNGQMFIWNLAQGTRVSSLAPYEGQIVSVAFSTSESQIVTVGTDAKGRHKIIVWNLAALLQAQVTLSNVNDHHSAIARQISDFSVTKSIFDPNIDSALISCGRENIRLWRVKHHHLSGRPILLNEYCRGFVYLDMCIVREATESFIFAASNRGIVLKISYSNERILTAYQLHTEPINTMQVFNGYAVTGSDDCKLRLWPMDFGDFLLEARHEGGVQMVNGSRNGRQLAIGTKAGTLGLLNVSKHSYETILRSHTSSIIQFSSRAGEAEVASISSDRTTRVWSVQSGIQTVEFTSDSDEPTALTYHHSTHTLFCGYRSGVVRVFDVVRAATVAELVGVHHSPIHCVKSFRMSVELTTMSSTTHEASAARTTFANSHVDMLLSIDSAGEILLVDCEAHCNVSSFSSGIATVSGRELFVDIFADGRFAVISSAKTSDLIVLALPSLTVCYSERSATTTANSASVALNSTGVFGNSYSPAASSSGKTKQKQPLFTSDESLFTVAALNSCSATAENTCEVADSGLDATSQWSLLLVTNRRVLIIPLTISSASMCLVDRDRVLSRRHDVRQLQSAFLSASRRSIAMIAVNTVVSGDSMRQASNGSPAAVSPQASVFTKTNVSISGHLHTASPSASAFNSSQSNTTAVQRDAKDSEDSISQLAVVAIRREQSRSTGRYRWAISSTMRQRAAADISLFLFLKDENQAVTADKDGCLSVWQISTAGGFAEDIERAPDSANSNCSENGTGNQRAVESPADCDSLQNDSRTVSTPCVPTCRVEDSHLNDVEHDLFSPTSAADEHSLLPQKLSMLDFAVADEQHDKGEECVAPLAEVAEQAATVVVVEESPSANPIQSLIHSESDSHMDDEDILYPKSSHLSAPSSARQSLELSMQREVDHRQTLAALSHSTNSVDITCADHPNPVSYPEAHTHEDSEEDEESPDRCLPSQGGDNTFLPTASVTVAPRYSGVFSRVCVGPSGYSKFVACVNGNSVQLIDAEEDEEHALVLDVVPDARIVAMHGFGAYQSTILILYRLPSQESTPTAQYRLALWQQSPDAHDFELHWLSESLFFGSLELTAKTMALFALKDNLFSLSFVDVQNGSDTRLHYYLLAPSTTAESNATSSVLFSDSISIPILSSSQEVLSLHIVDTAMQYLFLTTVKYSCCIALGFGRAVNSIRWIEDYKTGDRLLASYAHSLAINGRKSPEKFVSLLLTKSAKLRVHVIDLSQSVMSICSASLAMPVIESIPSWGSKTCEMLCMSSRGKQSSLELYLRIGQQMRNFQLSLLQQSTSVLKASVHSTAMKSIKSPVQLVDAIFTSSSPEEVKLCLVVGGKLLVRDKL